MGGLLFAGVTYKRPYNPKSDYTDTFKPIGVRRGYKVPVRVLPAIPMGKMDLVSVSHNDFVPLPIDHDRKNIKPEEKAFKSDAANREPPHRLLFQGKFPDVVDQGKPGTSYKKAETAHLSDAKFDGSSSSKSIYTLPNIVTEDNMPVFTKKSSKKNRESMRKSSGKMEKMTKYKTDHPGYETFPRKRQQCPPEPDKLQLFSHGKIDGIATEQQANFKKWKDQPKPSTPFYKTKYEAPNSSFEGLTSNMDQFKPVRVEQHVAELTKTNQIAAELGYSQRDGKAVKLAQHFGGQFTASTTNKSEYSQYWQTTPRVRYGYSYEKSYKPSPVKFCAQSEMKRHFTALDAKPAKSFKPRFHPPSKQKIENSTAYREDFPFRALPRREVFPWSHAASVKAE